MNKKIALIVAYGLNKEIGRNNDLIWHLPKDMQFFKETTKQHVVIMGRKNWESIPEKFRPLPNRKNIVISRNKDYQAPGAIVFTNLKDAINQIELEENQKIFIIGGAQIYQTAIDQLAIDELYITHINSEFKDADTFFPDNLSLSNYEKETEDKHLKDEKHLYDFNIVKYTKK